MNCLTTVCSNCRKVLQNPDDLYSTRCGHLFHFSCMNEWQRRSTSCPECHTCNVTTHKIYLSFDENFENQEEIKLKLNISNEKITQLLVQNSEIEANFMKLQDKYTKTEETKRELVEKIRQINDSKENVKHLQRQYTQSTERIKELENLINQLLTANDSKTKELQLKKLENVSLRDGNGSNQAVMFDTILNERIKILEQKFQTVSAQLTKEITANTQLSIEKIKLESYIKHLNIKVKTESASEQYNKPNQSSKQNQKDKPLLMPLSHHQDETHNRSIIIMDLPRYLVCMPLKMIVVNLALKCNMTISADDLVNVNFLEKTGLQSPRSKLFAEFKTSSLKTLFLSKKHMLKKDRMFEMIKITEFLAEEAFDLFNFAKRNLKGKGFHCIFAANNKIYAKEHKNSRSSIEIKSKSHVKELQLHSHKKSPNDCESSNSSISNHQLKMPNNFETGVDDNYYQLVKDLCSFKL